jgi:hypothetical protein
MTGRWPFARRPRPDPLAPVLEELGRLHEATAALAARLDETDTALRWMIGEVSQTAQRSLALTETVHHMARPGSPDALPDLIRTLDETLRQLGDRATAQLQQLLHDTASVYRHLDDTDSALRWMLGELSTTTQETVGLARSTHHEVVNPTGATKLGSTPWERRIVEILQYIADEDAATRRLVWAMRADPGYSEPFEHPDPLVSIVVSTYDRYELLRTRSIPSALAQTHANIEILVVGETSPPQTGEVLAGFGDPRIRYTNLNRRGPYPDDPVASWFVAGTMPMNEALRQARGHWIAFLDDDDSMRPDHIEKLLTGARAHRAELCYGMLHHHAPDETTLYGSFPPQKGFNWLSALMHRGLRTIAFDTSAALFNEPGDWHLCRRLVSAGVDFHLIDDVVADYYPARLWVDHDAP